MPQRLHRIIASSSFLGQYKGITEALELFGIPEKEAGVYVTILIGGSLSAGDISKELGLHRLDVYNALKNLQRRDMVEVSLSRPMIFKAVALESVLDMLNLKHRDNVKKERTALTKLEEVAKKLDQNTQEEKLAENKDRFQIIGGKKAIHFRWFKLLSSAQNEILIAATERETARLLLSDVLDTISAKIKAGVKVNVLTPVTSSNRDQLIDFKEQIRHLTVSSSAGLCIIDRKKAMMVLLPTSGKRYPQIQSKVETAVLMDSKSIGEILGTLFFVGWDTSPLVEDVIEQSNLHV